MVHERQRHNLCTLARAPYSIIPHPQMKKSAKCMQIIMGRGNTRHPNLNLKRNTQTNVNEHQVIVFHMPSNGDSDTLKTNVKYALQIQINKKKRPQ